MRYSMVVATLGDKLELLYVRYVSDVEGMNITLNLFACNSLCCSSLLLRKRWAKVLYIFYTRPIHTQMPRLQTARHRTCNAVRWTNTAHTYIYINVYTIQHCVSSFPLSGFWITYIHTARERELSWQKSEWRALLCVSARSSVSMKRWEQRMCTWMYVRAPCYTQTDANAKYIHTRITVHAYSLCMSLCVCIVKVNIRPTFLWWGKNTPGENYMGKLAHGRTYIHTVERETEPGNRNNLSFSEFSLDSCIIFISTSVFAPLLNLFELAYFAMLLCAPLISCKLKFLCFNGS